LEVSQAEFEDLENWSQEFISITYLIDAVDQKRQRIRLILPKDSKIKNEDGTLSYSFKGDVPFLKEEVFSYWDLKKNCFLY
jgi:hypothetical protein